MSSAARLFEPGCYYHIYNRGADQKLLFRQNSDYLFFLQKLYSNSKKFEVGIVAYCIMPNHYHLIAVEPEAARGKSRIHMLVHRLQTSFAMYYNRINKKAGYVFQGRFGTKHVDTNKYLALLVCYLHYNPVQARLARTCDDWPHSSARAYSREVTDPIVNRSLLVCEADYDQIYSEYLLFREEKNRFMKDVLYSE